MSTDTGRIRANVQIAQAINAKTYLEIGCQADQVFSAMPVETKVGVDPMSGGNIRMTSDKLFELLRRANPQPGDIVWIDDVRIPASFNLIFIDGDHHHDQVAKDVRNALDFLAPGGVITMHDVFPPDANHESQDLCGTAWRAFVHETRTRPDVEAYVSDIDTYGLGILRVMPNTKVIVNLPSYEKTTYEKMIKLQSTWMRKLPHDQVLTALGLK